MIFPVENYASGGNSLKSLLWIQRICTRKAHEGTTRALRWDGSVVNTCEGVLEQLGLNPEYVRGVVRRWLRESGLR